MKKLKIILAAVAFVAITVVIVFAVSKLSGPETVELPKNAFAQRIEGEIDSLAAMPLVSSNDYKTIKYHLDDYFSGHRLGKDDSDTLGNRNSYESYSRILFSTYADKFVEQSKSAFSQSNLKLAKVNAISSEVESLFNEAKVSSIQLLDSSSPTYTGMMSLRRAVKDYRTIYKFLSQCSSLSSFSESDLKDRISKAEEYLSSRLGGEYPVARITELSASLNKVPETLFKCHGNHLRTQIAKARTSSIVSSASYNDFQSRVYNSLVNELNLLSYDIYGDAFSYSVHEAYSRDIEAVLSEAYDYFFN